MLAVNHLNSQIKLTELWKAVNNADHPFKISKISDDSNITETLLEQVLMAH